jgi:long-chain acyl-CoA synthetase
MLELYILFKSKEIIDLNQKRITYHSKSLAQYEIIKQFRLLPNAFTAETGEITPTLKMRRKNSNEKYTEIIDSMYE